MAFAVDGSVVKSLSKYFVSKRGANNKAKCGILEVEVVNNTVLFTTNHLPGWQDQWRKEITYLPT